ncbi:MAG: hypothetical protein WA892_10880 [Ornithinimicrobium sp.]
MKRARKLWIAAVLGLGMPLAGASAAQAGSTWECHVFDNGKVHCEPMVVSPPAERLPVPQPAERVLR